MILNECGAGVSGMLRFVGSGLLAPRVRCGVWVSYERDVMSLGATCELYEEVVASCMRRLLQELLGMYDPFFAEK